MSVAGWKALAISTILLAGIASAQTDKSAVPVRTSVYLTDKPLDFSAIIAPPPASGSDEAKADMAAVLQAQSKRTPLSAAAAQHDDLEEDIFIYASVLGERFNADALPLSNALSKHVRGEAGTVTPMLKELYGRPRPFVVNKAVHPVCEQKVEPSYPSGHAMVGYLEALTLAQMVPEKAAEILARAHAYAENRVICGVHYPSDVEASHMAALAEFGALATSQKFRTELAAAKTELRTALGLQEHKAPR